MTYATRGAGISAVEVTSISKHGFWLLLGDEELFLPFETFPWFRQASVGKILHVELPAPHHLFWPELDIDLEVESILHPERYPLASMVHETGERYPVVKPESGVDSDRIDDCALALMWMTLHGGDRVWKSIDFGVMDRLSQKGYILDPRGKAKSVVLTREGLTRAERLFGELFGKH